MTSITTTQQRPACPRCSQPTTHMDAWPDSQCGFCRWLLDDPGIECVMCRAFNRGDAQQCAGCARPL